MTEEPAEESHYNSQLSGSTLLLKNGSLQNGDVEKKKTKKSIAGSSPAARKKVKQKTTAAAAAAAAVAAASQGMRQIHSFTR